MNPLCYSYVKWDSHWRPAGKRCTTQGTLELMLPWIGSWAIWMILVGRAVRLYQKWKHHWVLMAPLTLRVLLFSDWLQTSRPPWFCQAAAPAPGLHPQRASPRSTWQPLSPWASAETRQPKHFEQRLESNSIQLAFRILLISHATCLKVKPCQYWRICCLLFKQWSSQVFFML